ncbi:MAG: YchJ family protein [Sulfurimonadaceae bacterium]
MICPCGSNREYKACCQPCHNQAKSAQTPEELMRSRYAAFALGEAEYLFNTSLVKHHAPNELEQLKAQIAQVEWLKLDLVDAYDNVVEFKAYYRDESGIHLLHEKSTFIYENSHWFYDEGTLYNTKIERNEVCPCGSGKKYKKCCGRS